MTPRVAEYLETKKYSGVERCEELCGAERRIRAEEARLAEATECLY